MGSNMTQSNLVVVAHPDDEILGFGGSGARLVMAGEIVQPLIMCGNVDARTKRPSDKELESDIAAANNKVGFKTPILGSFPNIRMNSVPHIELVAFIESAIEKVQPTRIFTHHPGDPNDDHKQVAGACLAAFRLFQRRSSIAALKSLHLMEIQSSTDWAVDPSVSLFRPNLFVEMGGTLDLKIESLQCYRNVMRDFPHPRSEEAIRGLSAYRGGQSGQRYSEAFETVFQREF